MKWWLQVSALLHKKYMVETQYVYLLEDGKKPSSFEAPNPKFVIKGNVYKWLYMYVILGQVL